MNIKDSSLKKNPAHIVHMYILVTIITRLQEGNRTREEPRKIFTIPLRNILPMLMMSRRNISLMRLIKGHSFQNRELKIIPWYQTSCILWSLKLYLKMLQSIMIFLTAVMNPVLLYLKEYLACSLLQCLIL